MAETSEGSFEWTQEMTDQYIAEYEQTLEEIPQAVKTRASEVASKQPMAFVEDLIHCHPFRDLACFPSFSYIIIHRIVKVNNIVPTGTI